MWKSIVVLVFACKSRAGIEPTRDGRTDASPLASSLGSPLAGKCPKHPKKERKKNMIFVAPPSAHVSVSVCRFPLFVLPLVVGWRRSALLVVFTSEEQRT